MHFFIFKNHPCALQLFGFCISAVFCYKNVNQRVYAGVCVFNFTLCCIRMYTHTHTQQTTANSTAATHKEPAGSNLCSQHVNVIQRWGVVYVCVCVCVGMNVWVCLPLSVMTNRLKQRAKSRPVAVLDVLFSLDSVNTCRLLPTVLIHPVTCCFAHLCLYIC